MYETQLPTMRLKEVKNTLVVASGKGGVGKSTVSANLAVSLAKEGARVGLLDADIYGPSIPMIMGLSEKAIIKQDRYQPLIAHGVQTMSIGLLTTPAQALIWRGPMLAKALIQLIDHTAWDDLDYLIIDLPPGTGDIQLSLVQKIPISGAVIVSTPQSVCTQDADKAIQMFSRTRISLLGLIENMSYHHCKKCGQEEAIFGSQGVEELAKNYQIPLLGKLPLLASIREKSDKGEPDAFTNPIWQTITSELLASLQKKPSIHL